MSDSRSTAKNASFDIAVVGAGSAGFSAAITAASSGATVALLGHGTIGGTCVNVGCVPSKALIRAMQIVHVSQSAQNFSGLSASTEINDWKTLVAQKQALVDDLRSAKYIDVLPSYESLSYREGLASFAKDGQLTLDDDIVRADKIIIATGSRPALPAIDGIQDIPYLTSTSALELETLPESLLIIGAGFIGCEMAQIFARAGVAVTLVSRRGLLPSAEPEISQTLTQCFSDESITVISGVDYQRIDARQNVIELRVKHHGQNIILNAQQVMIASGRSANVESLNLANAGIDLNDRRGIQVDACMRTTASHVYAAGDVTGSDQFVYMAAYGAKVAAQNALSGADTVRYDNSIVPEVVFSDPQVAMVGLTEAAAKYNGTRVKTSVLGLEHLPRALAARDTRGLIKLVVDADNNKLIGAHILAPEGADSIQTAAMAIRAGMTYQELGAMIFPYLTTVEGLKLAAQTFDMDVDKLSCCAG